MLSPHLPPIPRKQKQVLAKFAAEATKARHRSGLLDALGVHERELEQLRLCAELALRWQLGDSCGVQQAQSAIAACSVWNAQGLVDAMTESNLEEAAVHAEMRMRQEVGTKRIPTGAAGVAEV